MKFTQIKIWPELTGDTPSLCALTGASKPTPFLSIDFSNTVDVDSCGLTISLLKLFEFFEILKEKYNDVSWKSNNDRFEAPILDKIIHLGFFKCIEWCHFKEQQQTLLSSDYFQHPKKEEFFIYKDVKKTSHPIFDLKLHSNSNRRLPIKDFKTFLFRELIPLEDKYKINTRQLITILYEFAKNSADHTFGNAYFGLDTIESPDTIEINFVFGDTGCGIKKNIQSYIERKAPHRKGKFSLVEAYYLACKKGFTSLPNSGANLGVGMSTAIESAQLIGVTLSVFDAQSRGLLSKLKGVTHSEIRKIFFPGTQRNPFCYYGTIKVGNK